MISISFINNKSRNLAMVKIVATDLNKTIRKDSKAKSTQSKYLGDWLKFEKYSQNYNNCHPFDVDSEDDAYQLTSNYMSWLYGDDHAIIYKGESLKTNVKNTAEQNPYSNKEYKASTIARILTSITYYYRNNPLSDKSKNKGKFIYFNRKDKRISETISSIKRDKDNKVDRAKALLKEDIMKIIDKIDINSDDLTDIRDQALILVGFYSFCRRSEILNMKYEDLNIRDQAIIVNIPFSKTDQQGVGRKVSLPKKDDRYCPVKTLLKWLEVAQIESGPLFYRINKSSEKDSIKRINKYQLDKNNIRVSLSVSAFNLILKKRAFASGYNMEEISGHSLRRGAITEARNQKVPIHNIKAQSGHKSPQMVDVYTEVQDIEEESAANKI